MVTRSSLARSGRTNLGSSFVNCGRNIAKSSETMTSFNLSSNEVGDFSSVRQYGSVCEIAENPPISRFHLMLGKHSLLSILH